MKKLIALLIIFISFLSITVVHADMSAPEMRAFEVEVTASNGVDYYKWDGTVAGHLNKGDKVYVIYEYNGVYTLGINTTKYGIETKESIGDVKSLDGFTIVEKEVKPDIEDDRIIKYDEDQKAIVYSSNGVDIFSGPDDAYEKVGHIKKDVTLSYKYALKDMDITYIYVTYENTSGWVEILEGKVLIQNDTQYIFRNDVDTKCGIIPRNTITTPTYRTDKWDHKTLFEYNNCKILLDSFRDSEILDVFVSYQKNLKDIAIFKDADPSSEIVGTIPAGSIITVFAGGDFMSGTESVRYVKYNDLVGWSLDNDAAFEYISQPETIEEEKIEDTVKVEEQKTPEDVKPVIQKKNPIETLILLCGFGIGLLIITALVVIILINRKKAVKKEEK